MNIGFIGVGHMAGSILRALSKEEGFSFYVNDHHLDKMMALEREYKGRVFVTVNQEILNQCPFVFLGVKPCDMNALLASLGKDHPRTIFVSMAAGYSLDELEMHLGNSRLIRIMPNTPVLVSKGVTFASYRRLSKDEKETFERMMTLTGKLHEINEEKMDVVSVLTGSSPAYLDAFADALMHFGQANGLDEKEATEYVWDMVEGAALLGRESGKSPKTLKEEVCSPGGSTIEGVWVLDDAGFEQTIQKAAEASLTKTKNMR